LKKILSIAKQFKQIAVILIMKKGFSIFLSLLMLGAIMHLSVATHYCEGKEIAKTVSLSGKLASCGMKCLEMELPLTGTNFTNHCCDDIVTFFGIDSNYSPIYSFLPETYQHNFQILAIPVELSIKSQTNINPLYTNVSPPGALMSTYVDLSSICVFRI
jgi:hypothetical protein